MIPASRRSRYRPPPSRVRRAAVPVIATAAASLIPLFPAVMSTPLLPPLGLMTLVAWRLLRRDLWPLWAALPLGAWDDLFSGAPIGTAMCGWTAVLIALEVADARAPWRGYRTDWAVAVAAIAAMQLFALLIAWIAGATPGLLLLVPQTVLSALLFPAVVRWCASLDRWRMTG